MILRAIANRMIDRDWIGEMAEREHESKEATEQIERLNRLEQVFLPSQFGPDEGTITHEMDTHAR